MNYIAEFFDFVNTSNDLEKIVQLDDLSNHSSQTDTADIVFLPVSVPLFRVVDANSHKVQLLFCHNAFFRVSSAVNHVPIAAGGPIHVKEFLYTTPPPYEFGVQSETHVDDRIHQHSHNNHKHLHVSDHDEEFPPQSYDVAENDLETKW